MSAVAIQIHQKTTGDIYPSKSALPPPLTQMLYPYTAIIIDLSDVLFRTPAQRALNISSHELRTIAHTSNAWYNFEKGLLTKEDCYMRVATECKLDPIEVQRSFDQVHDSLHADNGLFALLRELKTSNGLRIFGMVNISMPHLEALRSKPADWSVFDDIFASCIVGERKPTLGFYQRVIEAASLDPKKVVFIDDEFASVFAARSIGMHGIVFEEPAGVERSLRNLFGDPLKRSHEFLRRNAAHLDCITRQNDSHESVVIYENWTQLLILEAMNDRFGSLGSYGRQGIEQVAYRTLVDFVEYPGRWPFFKGIAQLTTPEFPTDLDTTSLGLTILKAKKEIADPIMDDMHNYVDSDGIFLSYFDHERPRVDAGICINVLTLFYAYGRGAEAEPTLRWIQNILRYRAYLEGTRYFDTPECFLWLLSRLLSYSRDVGLHATLKPLLAERLRERIGMDGDALAIAMRILGCEAVGIRSSEADLSKLRSLQCIDGGWEAGWVFHYSTMISVGSRGLTTALAIKAIMASQSHDTDA